MNTLGRAGRAALTGLSAAVLLGLQAAKPDPWELPAPDVAQILLAIDASKRNYTIRPLETPPRDALPAERVDPPASDAEKRSLEACRALIEKSAWPEAETAARVLLAANPALHDARTLLARALLSQAKAPEAAIALRDGLIGNRRNPEAWALLAQVAEALGKKVARPTLPDPCWVRETGKNETEIGMLVKNEADDTAAWLSYGLGRAYYRFEGPFDAAFPGKTYAPTIREHLFGVGAVLVSAEAAKKDGEKLPPDLLRLLGEKKAGTVVPFVFFAMFPDPIPATPEKDFELLRPRLEKYFDEKILVRK